MFHVVRVIVNVYSPSEPIARIRTNENLELCLTPSISCLLFSKKFQRFQALLLKSIEIVRPLYGACFKDISLGETRAYE